MGISLLEFKFPTFGSELENSQLCFGNRRLCVAMYDSFYIYICRFIHIHIHLHIHMIYIYIVDRVAKTKLNLFIVVFYEPKCTCAKFK
jgi:hypothetical protein